MSDATVYCNNCGRQLDASHDDLERQPCPNCGGLTRRYHEQLTVNLRGSGANAISGRGELTVRPPEIRGVGAVVEQEDAGEAHGTVVSPGLVKALDSDRDYVVGVLNLSKRGRAVMLTVNGEVVDLHLSDMDGLGDVLLEIAIEIESREQGNGA